MHPVIVAIALCVTGAAALDVQHIKFNAPTSLAAGGPSSTLPAAQHVATLSAKAPRSAFKKNLLHGLRSHRANGKVAVLAGS
jgi:hypothetical protein